jgi:hypothetical protein
MPNADVTLNINSKELFTAADSTGYYQFKLTNLKAGNYTLYASATYYKKHSLSPTKKLNLKFLTLWEEFLLFLQGLWNNFLRLLTSLSLGPL